MSVEIEIVVDERMLVGESPRWDHRDNSFWWVDIYEPSLNRLDPRTGARRKWRMPEKIGCFGFTRRGRIIAGMQSGIALIDLEPDGEARVERVFDLHPLNPDFRFNDGRVDPGGRFWAGSIVESMDRRVGALYRYDPDGTGRKMVDLLIGANGMAFSPDGRTMYHSDSRQDYVWAWDFDPATSAITNQRVFQQMDIQEGRADGAATDTAGGYWICHVGAWRVARYHPDGKIDRVIGLPVQRPTACTFGGENLDVLYVTSATYPLAQTMLAKQPLAGSLFAIHGLGVRGIPEPLFAD
jgi:L-arabinonolactonase